MKSKGPLSKHIIRRAKRPVIAEVDTRAKPVSVAPTREQKAKLKSVPPEPKYKITEVEEGGEVKGLVVEVELGDAVGILVFG